MDNSWRISVVFTLALAMGCTSTPPITGDNQNISGDDANSGQGNWQGDTGNTWSDDTGSGTTADADVQAQPGEFGAGCTVNEDCFSGYCVPSSEGDLLCTKTCEDACPEGWSCKPDPGGAETSYICVQDQINLCRPCQSN